MCHPNSRTKEQTERRNWIWQSEGSYISGRLSKYLDNKILFEQILGSFKTRGKIMWNMVLLSFFLGEFEGGRSKEFSDQCS